MPGTRILTTFIYTRQCRVRALKGLNASGGHLKKRLHLLLMEFEGIQYMYGGIILQLEMNKMV
jgi:hypothetical protein